ncbi:MAG: hypothetical protein HY460_02920 [Parcubacteria group bacterium]|nr:hypothetical protein [Parcubacteria group bacterium]
MNEKTTIYAIKGKLSHPRIFFKGRENKKEYTRYTAYLSIAAYANSARDLSKQLRSLFQQELRIFYDFIPPYGLKIVPRGEPQEKLVNSSFFVTDQIFSEWYPACATP